MESYVLEKVMENVYWDGSGVDEMMKYLKTMKSLHLSPDVTQSMYSNHPCPRHTPDPQHLTQLPQNIIIFFQIKNINSYTFVSKLNLFQ